MYPHFRNAIGSGDSGSGMGNRLGLSFAPDGSVCFAFVGGESVGVFETCIRLTDTCWSCAGIGGTKR